MFSYKTNLSKSMNKLKSFGQYKISAFFYIKVEKHRKLAANGSPSLLDLPH